MARSKRKRNMSFRQVMDLVPDDMPDGAFFAMAHEMAGLEYGEGFDELAEESLDPEPPKKKKPQAQKARGVTQMDKATEIPMTDCGLSINCGEDGVWLHFKASDGKHASLKVQNLHSIFGDGIIGTALDSWCSDRQKQTEEIRARVKE